MRAQDAADLADARRADGRASLLLIDALEEIRDPQWRDLRLLKEAQRMRIGLTLGHARVAELHEHEADVGERAAAAAQHQLRRSAEPDCADNAGLGMQLEAVPHLVRQHA